MKIIVKEKGKTKVFLWLPSYSFIIRAALKRAKLDGVSLTKSQIDQLMEAIRVTKKYHRTILDIDIQSKNGESVFVKI